MMAFNPDPKVAEARAIAKKYKKTKVIILMVDDWNGTLEYASYGETPTMCREAKQLADAAYEAVYKAIVS
jgi:hypothetical protein